MYNMVHIYFYSPRQVWMEAWHLFYAMQCASYAIKGKPLFVQFISHPVKYFSCLIRAFEKNSFAKDGISLVQIVLIGWRSRCLLWIKRKGSNIFQWVSERWAMDIWEICKSVCRLGFEAPQNYNLADFYIQTLAILPHDKETSIERVEVSPISKQKKTIYNQSLPLHWNSTSVISTKNHLSIPNM